MIENNPMLLSSRFHDFFSESGAIVRRSIYLDTLEKEKSCVFNKSEEKNSNEKYDLLTIVVPVNLRLFDVSSERILKKFLSELEVVGVENILFCTNNDSQEFKKFISDYENTFNIKTFCLNCTEYNLAKILNNSLKNVVTPFVAIMDYDILLKKDTFEEALSYLASDIDFLYPANKKLILNNISDDINNSNDNFLDLDCFNDVLFCKKDSLINVGGFNSDFIESYAMNYELTIRINMSTYLLKTLNGTYYELQPIDKNFNDIDENTLMKYLNLSKYDDININIFENMETFYCCYPEKYPKKENSDEYKLSIIIPEYNCERFYIDRCITSLFNQSIGFENIEIIIVDDASVYDESKDIVREYSQKYENIKSVFLEKNVGPGLARNEGMKYSSAKFITFLDHDNYFLESYCEKMFNCISNNDVDLVKAQYIEIFDAEPRIIDIESLGFNSQETYLKSYKDNINIFEMPPTVCATFYRKSFLEENNILFKDYLAAEDNLFNSESVLKAEGIIFINTYSIVYTLRSNDNDELKSISLTKDKNILISRLKAYKEINKLFDKYEPEYAIYKLNGAMNYWTDTQLTRIHLSKKDFIEVVNEGMELFKLEAEYEELKMAAAFRELYSLISKKNYEKSYELYKRLIK